MSKEIVKTTTYEEDIITIKDTTTKAFLISGNILSNIQDDKKYKENGYKTFAEAVKNDLGLEVRQAYRLIDAANTYQNVTNWSQNLPTAESQLRPIAKLTLDKQEAVWKKASKDGVPTAKKVKETILELYPALPKNTTSSKKVDTISVEDYNKMKKELDSTKKMLQNMILSKNTQRAEGLVQTTTTPPPSFSPPTDNSKVLVDAEELSELVACQAQLLLLKDELKAMSTLLTPEQRLRWDNKDKAGDTTFEQTLSTKRKITEMVKEHQKG